MTWLIVAILDQKLFWPKVDALVARRDLEEAVQSCDISPLQHLIQRSDSGLCRCIVLEVLQCILANTGASFEARGCTFVAGVEFMIDRWESKANDGTVLLEGMLCSRPRALKSITWSFHNRGQCDLQVISSAAHIFISKS